MPFLLFGLTSWFIYHVNYISDDGYAQLMIARNLALHGRQSFSDIFPTNGFQPLWQYLLAGYSWQVIQIKPQLAYQAAFAIPLSGALLVVGIWQLQRLGQQLGLSMLFLVFVPAAWLLMFDLLYSEAHLLFAAVAVLARRSFAGSEPSAGSAAPIRPNQEGITAAPAAAPLVWLRTPTGAAWAGLAAAAVFLAQLESLGLIACYLLWLAVTTRSGRSVAICGVVFALPAGAYLAGNVFYFGGPLPINDWLDTSFPAVSWKGFQFAWLATTLGGYNVLFGWLPILLGAVAISTCRAASGHSRHFALVLWGGCLLQLAWIALFTRPHADSYRHYVLPMLLAGYALAIFWRRLTARWGNEAPRVVTASAVLAIVLAGLWVGLTISLRWSDPNQPDKPSPIKAPLEFLQGQQIVGATILASDLPGSLAWRTTPNNVVDASFRLDYRPLYERVLQAPNAFQALQAEYAALGCPLRVIVYVVGSQCMEPDEQFTSLTLYDPRALPERKPIGKLQLPAGAAVFNRFNGKLHSVVWDLGRQRRKEKE